jgi:hypothetical protein
MQRAPLCQRSFSLLRTAQLGVPARPSELGINQALTSAEPVDRCERHLLGVVRKIGAVQPDYDAPPNVLSTVYCVLFS